MDEHETLNPAVDRRGMLRHCGGWAGAAALYSISGGVLSSVGIDQAIAAGPRADAGDLALFRRLYTGAIKP